MLQADTKITVPLVVDLAMVVALLSLSYFTGIMANKVETQGIEIAAVRTQLNSNIVIANTAKIAAIEVTNIAQDQRMFDFKETLIRRLDRIESKLDRGR